MARYPDATWRPIDSSYLPSSSLSLHNRVNLHTAVALGSLHGYFNQPNRPSSHFYVLKSGAVEQYVDTGKRAEADLDGNDATVSIETEGGTSSDPDAETWTPAQVEAIVDLCRWIMDTHNIPLRLATSSKTDSTSKGLSWHRLGIDGNFPALPSILAGRQQRGGGMHYSSSFGKVCPGDKKIEQVPGILEAILGGPLPDTPPPPSSGGANLVVDGWWGEQTTRRLQQELGTPVDGILSHQIRMPENQAILSAQWDNTGKGSQCIRAVQSLIAMPSSERDGLIGPKTITAIQKYLDTPVDGYISEPSAMVKEMQRRLNARL